MLGRFAESLPMKKYKNGWSTREKAFASFVTGPLLDFWRRREEREFAGIEKVLIRYACFTSPQHDKVILLVPGRIESYLKYSELAYDLYHCGYDVFIIDHRGQGRSGRLLQDPHRGHVSAFDDYVDDLAQLWQQEIAVNKYRCRYALAHSMGGAILTLLLAQKPQALDAVVLVAPMFGICLPMPEWMVKPILNWAEKRPTVREGYALGAGKWRSLSFGINLMTHSNERYRRNLRFYADNPAIRLGGPTYHWVHEGMEAGKRILGLVPNIHTPILLLQAGKDKIVDNRAQDLFCEAMRKAGHPCEGGKPRVIAGARHEILFERDDMRSEALNAIIEFYIQHC